VQPFEVPLPEVSWWEEQGRWEVQGVPQDLLLSIAAKGSLTYSVALFLLKEYHWRHKSPELLLVADHIGTLPVHPAIITEVPDSPKQSRCSS
jgi:hypothetical protein